MIRQVRNTASLLATLAVVVGVAAGAQAAAIDMNVNALQHADPSVKWYKKYSGELNDKQASKISSLVANGDADKAAEKQAKWLEKAAKKQAKWYEKMASKPIFANTGGGNIYVKKAKSPAIFTTTDAIVNANYSASFNVGAKPPKGEVGFVIGYQGHETGSDTTSFIKFGWKTDTKAGESAYTLDLVEGLHSGKGMKKNELYTGESSENVTITSLGSWDGGGYEAGIDYDVDISYTSTNLKISINGQVIFDIDGEFEEGAFGLYTVGQKAVNFFGLQAELLAGQDPNDYSSLTGALVDGVNDGTIPSGPLVISEAPTPAALPAGLALLGLAAVRRRRRHAA